ncbi:hypothetical protein [Deminuibacter soli]|uniref:Uncharacterized protein n=1 Tax=Deminuibacter soli TaxID=2291815 RepID=A0A3E1NQ26_9BACT|nr:hypothetical protein [Deminuibacter soli]RFM30035.1 hypothetical protein DXN05_03425 [Deminuibacter soli]
MSVILSIALIVLFLHACTWDGMILSWVHYLLENAPVWLRKPIYDCPACMTPWWGYLVLYLGNRVGFWEVHLTSVPFVLAIAAGINVVLSTLLIFLRDGQKRKCNCDRKARLGILNEDNNG